MHHTSHRTSSVKRILRRVSATSLCALALYLSACSPSSQALYQQARQAYDAGRFDEAFSLYEQMKAEEGASNEQRYQAHFGISEVHLARGDLKAQALTLEGLAQDKSMAGYLDVIIIKLEENYLKRAEALGLGDPQLVTLLTKAIEIAPKSKAKRLLAEHYMARGLDELKEEQFDNAEHQFKSALELKSADAPLNVKLSNHLRETRLKRYMKRARRLIEAQQDELATQVGFDRVNQRFTLSVSVSVEGRVSRRNQAELTTKATPLAEAAMSARIVQMLKELLNEPAEGALDPSLITSTSWTTGAIALAKRSQSVKREKKRVYMTSLSYEATLSLEELLRLAFMAHEQMPPAAEKPAAEEPAAEEPAAEEPAAGEPAAGEPAAQ